MSSRRIVFAIRCTGELPGGAVGELLFHPASLSAALSLRSLQEELQLCSADAVCTRTHTAPCCAWPAHLQDTLRWVAKPLKRPVDYGGELSLCHCPFFLLHYNDKIVLEAEQLINAESYS